MKKKFDVTVKISPVPEFGLHSKTMIYDIEADTMAQAQVVANRHYGKSVLSVLLVANPNGESYAVEISEEGGLVEIDHVLADGIIEAQEIANNIWGDAVIRVLMN